MNEDSDQHEEMMSINDDHQATQSDETANQF